MRLRFSREATRDLEEIGDWIAHNDAQAAARFTNELAAKARQIVEMPYAFPIVAEFAQAGLRKRSHRRYAIFYKVDRATVTVVRIIRHSRNYPALLRKP